MVKGAVGNWAFVGRRYVCVGPATALQRRHQSRFPRSRDDGLVVVILAKSVCFSYPSVSCKHVLGPHPSKPRGLGAKNSSRSSRRDFSTVPRAGWAGRYGAMVGGSFSSKPFVHRPSSRGETTSIGRNPMVDGMSLARLGSVASRGGPAFAEHYATGVQHGRSVAAARSTDRRHGLVGVVALLHGL